MAHPWLKHVRSDIVGGFVSSSVAIPLSMGYGMFAFVALGDGYFSNGVVAGLISALVVCLTAVALNDQSRAIYAPRIVTTFFIGALLRGMLHSEAAIFQDPHGELLPTMLLLTILLAGAFQLLFGLIHLGSLLKHTPYPVLAGFQNAAAILLFVVQISHVLGYEQFTPVGQLLTNLGQLKPLSLLIGALTFLVTWHAKRLLPRVPPVITGLVLGTSAYYLLVLLGLGEQLGARIGEGRFFSFGIFPELEFLRLARNPQLLEFLPHLVSGALGLAFVASLDALLCAKLLEGADARPDSNRQLVRLGLGNMLSAGLGGITGGINLGPSLINRSFGARSPLSVLVNVSLVLLTLCLLLPLVAYLPRAVLSGTIMVIAYQHLDASTIQLARRLLAGRLSGKRQMALDLAVILVVTTLAVVLNIVTAVVIGMLLAIVLFLLRMSRSVLRSSYDCALVRSRKHRDPGDEALLEAQAGQIHVLVLEGAIFFGTAERLVAKIDALVAQGARCIILNLVHITDIDSTGARMLHEVFEKLRKQRVALLLSHFKAQSHWGAMLTDVGLVAALTPAQICYDTDRAIEWAEDYLISDTQGRPTQDAYPLEQQPLFAGLSAQQRLLASGSFRHQRFSKGAVLFRQGDHGHELFIIARGSASAHLPNQDGGSTRLVTFSSGTLFGEIAILDRQPRSATVIADDELECYALTSEAFEHLKTREPSIAFHLLSNLGRELGARLRSANRTIYQLTI